MLNEQQVASQMLGKVSLEKDRVNLEKHVVNLSKCIVDLSKKSNIDLGSKVARVVLVLDYSGSMSGLYSSGVVQQAITKLVPLGLQFDDNGTIDTYLFHNGAMKISDINLDNYETYVTDVVNKSGMQYGGTNYSPVIKEIVDGAQENMDIVVEREVVTKHLFSSTTEVKKVHERVNRWVPSCLEEGTPTFVLFITDGDNADKEATDRVVRESSYKNVFIQFVGIGKAKFAYLEKLDNLDERAVDNTGFVKMADILKVSDSELYNSVLEQFADWLKETGY